MQPYDFIHKSGNSGLVIDSYINRIGWSTSTFYTNRILAQPFFVGDDGLRLGTLGIRVYASGTGLTKLAIFSNISPSNIYPSTILQDFGEYSLALTGNIIGNSQDITLPNGLYWIVNMTDAGTGEYTTIQTIGNEISYPGGSLGVPRPSGGFNPANQGLEKAYTYALGMPSTFPSSANTVTRGDYLPAILIQPY